MTTVQDHFHLLPWLAYLRTVPGGLVLLILAAGIIFLLYGRSVIQIAVMLNAAVLAGYLGWSLTVHTRFPHLFALGFAVIFGLLAWPLLKTGVAIFTGMMGAAVAGSLLMAVYPREQYVPLAAIVGFVICAIIGWHLLRPAIIAFTALQGSAMIVLSCAALIERIWPGTDAVMWMRRHNIAAMAVLLILAVLGIMYQGRVEEGAGGEKGSGSPAAESSEK